MKPGYSNLGTQEVHYPSERTEGSKKEKDKQWRRSSVWECRRHFLDADVRPFIEARAFARVIKRQDTVQWRTRQRRRHLSLFLSFRKMICPLNGTMDVTCRTFTYCGTTDANPYHELWGDFYQVLSDCEKNEWRNSAYISLNAFFMQDIRGVQDSLIIFNNK